MEQELRSVTVTRERVTQAYIDRESPPHPGYQLDYQSISHDDLDITLMLKYN